MQACRLPRYRFLRAWRTRFVARRMQTPTYKYIDENSCMIFNQRLRHQGGGLKCTYSSVCILKTAIVMNCEVYVIIYLPTYSKCASHTGRFQVMVFALKEQNRIIGQLRREANANFMLLDDRSRRTQDLVQKLVAKVRSYFVEMEAIRKNLLNLGL